jgi:hypothetical protein
VLKKTLAIATSTAIILGASMAYSATASRGEAMFKKADTNSDGAESKYEY